MCWRRQSRSCRRKHPDRSTALRVAGWRDETGAAYLERLAQEHDFEDHGYLSRERKFEFLSGLDALSVPTAYRASKGLYVLEALAAGVPAVQPSRGVFPELIEATGGGLTCVPDDSEGSGEQAGRIDERSRAGGPSRQRGAASGTEEFHVSRMASDALALYERIAR